MKTAHTFTPASNPKPRLGDGLPDLVDTKEAAKLLGIKPQTLEVWRSTGRYKLPYIKVGRLCKYRLDHLESFLASRLCDGHPTGGMSDGR